MGYYSWTIYQNIHKNDGSGVSESYYTPGTANVPQGSAYSATVEIHGNPFSREGYNFTGYRDGVGTSWVPGEGYTAYFSPGTGSKTINLYCQWQIKTYVVSFDSNGGENAPQSQIKTYGQDINIASDVPTRVNYIFKGWALTSTGAVVYQPEDSFSIDADTTLYAIWDVAAATLDSVDDTEIEDSGSASWTKVKATHAYKLKLTFGNAPVVTVNVAANVETCSFTIPASWYDYIPNAVSALATAVLETYTDANYNTLVGSTSKTFTITVPDDIVPAIDSFTVTPHSQNSVIENWGVAVQGYSYATLEVEADPGDGASILNILFVGQGINQTGTSDSGDTALLTGNGTMRYTVTVSDSRGRTATTYFDLLVYEYFTPVIESFQTLRCLSDGTISDTEGGYLKSLAALSFAAIGGNNSLTVKKIEYKQHDSPTWLVGVASVTSGSWSAVYGPADISKTFDVKCTITDTVGNSYALQLIVPPVVGFALGLDNDRARFGGPVEKPGLQVDWDAEFNGLVDITKRRCAATLSAAGWYRIMKVKQYAGGSHPFTVDIMIGQTYSNSNNFVHCVKFIRDYGYAEFNQEISKINTNAVTKIRFTTDADSNGYIDIYYNSANSNPVYANFLVNSRPIHAGMFESQDMLPMVAAPEGETVVTEYTFRTSTGAKFGALTASTLNSITTSLVTLTAGTSQAYSLSNSTRHVFFVVGLGTANQCIILVYVSSSGGVTYTMIPDTATNIEVTTATRSVTIKTVGQQARILRATF